MSQQRPIVSNTRVQALDRRSFLVAGTLSAAAIALLAGSSRLRASENPRGSSPARDADILNGALAAEYEAVAAYQVGAQSGLLKADVLKLAIKFRDHHKAHADVLARTVRKLGGAAAEPATHYDFPVHTLEVQDDVLEFAAGLERGAVSAYLGAVPLFGSGDLARAAASILGDEAMHWAVLRYVLGQDPVPVAFVS